MPCGLAVPCQHHRVQLLYAIAITGLGSSISVKLEKMENTLKKDRSKSPAQVEALVGFSDLTQNLIGYLVGCCWSDFVTTVFTSLGDNPEPWTIAQNFVITGAITTAAVAVRFDLLPWRRGHAGTPGGSGSGGMNDFSGRTADARGP